MAELRNVPIDQIKTMRFHDKLPQECELLSRVVYELAGRDLGDTYQEWSDSFCHDVHPSRELWVWAIIGLAWQAFKREHPEKVGTNAVRLIGLLAGATTGADIRSEKHSVDLLACLAKARKGIPSWQG